MAQRRAAQQREYRRVRSQRHQNTEAAFQKARADLDTLRRERCRLQQDNRALEQLVAYTSGMATAMGAAAAAVRNAVSTSAAAYHSTRLHFALFLSWLGSPSKEQIQVWLRSQGPGLAELDAASADFASRLAVEVRTWQACPELRAAIEAKVEIWLRTRTRLGAVLLRENPAIMGPWLRRRLLPPEADGGPNARLRPLARDLALTAEQLCVLERAWRMYQHRVDAARCQTRCAIASFCADSSAPGAASTEQCSVAAGRWLRKAEQEAAMAAHPMHETRAIYELMATMCGLVTPRQRIHVCIACGPHLLDMVQLCTMLFEEGGRGGGAQLQLGCSAMDVSAAGQDPSQAPVL